MQSVLALAETLDVDNDAYVRVGATAGTGAFFDPVLVTARGRKLFEVHLATAGDPVNGAQLHDSRARGAENDTRQRLAGCTDNHSCTGEECNQRTNGEVGHINANKSQ
jgi:hypothetical protein